MDVKPALAELRTFHFATLNCAWCMAEPSPSLLFSSKAAIIMCGSAPKNLIPSAPFFALKFTHSLACCCVLISSLKPDPKLE